MRGEFWWRNVLENVYTEAREGDNAKLNLRELDYEDGRWI
jgi:hypothetical protein